VRRSEARQFGPDIAFIDLKMPGVSGIELATRLSAEEWANAVELVALTRIGQNDDIAAATPASLSCDLSVVLTFGESGESPHSKTDFDLTHLSAGMGRHVNAAREQAVVRSKCTALRLRQRRRCVEVRSPPLRRTLGGDFSSAPSWPISTAAAHFRHGGVGALLARFRQPKTSGMLP
jgi:CheY-like chemotaxis protein